ncbi:uncharacterized protein LOC128483919 [Spea bombifrons]|uniref:uncharacterized protein LOC128483919 n=1 Tax=Spea bombifrons TaxID=233779 RepID=UPI002349072E|nr:uncharacterized protein LOC128483919 [Spea bombifrons]
MNNCDLEKLSVPGVKLVPPFRPDITSYNATVPSQITQITLDMYPSDTGASCALLGGGSSKCVTLKDGLNNIVVEVTAEDGTEKNYILEVTKMSASQASLQDIKLPEDLKLIPSFLPDVYEYSCTVPFFQDSITIHPFFVDKKMSVKLNGSDDIKPIPLAFGDTLIELQVTSADGTRSQVYSLIVTRSALPCCVHFVDPQDQVNYECPISLTAFYRPVCIKGSDPKHIISGPYMDLLTRRSKTDPLDETPLQENWRVPEYELDMKMSAAIVRCIFAYRGCSSVIKLSEFGHHAQSCSFKPQTELDAKDVTETDWYKEFCATKKCEHLLKHTVQEKSWEKKLQQESEDSPMDKLCAQAEQQIVLYKQCLSIPGDALHYQEGTSPLDALHQAAVAYASAIKLKPRDAKLHFQLGMVLEEHYYAEKIYGLRKKSEEHAPDFSNAKSTGKDEEILAICKLHGFSGKPSVEQQLKALDAEYHQLKEQGQSGKADTVQNLFAWKSKQAGKTGAFSIDEENPLTQAFLKYEDALCLDPSNWLYNLHVGRHLLLQNNKTDALLLLQNALALNPASAIARCYVGLAYLEQDDASNPKIQESILYLHQGLEMMLSGLLTSSDCTKLLQVNNLFCLLNFQLLGGFLKLGKLLKRNVLQPSHHIMPAIQILHIVADWTAKGLHLCPPKGEITQGLERVLQGSCYSLLEHLVQDAPHQQDWIRMRCQAMSALIRLTSIPECKELLDMQEKVCRLGVIASPCNSYSLYLLGLAQLARYDKSSSEDAQSVLQDAMLSFKASISLENMPTKGPAPPELTNQKWWQEFKAAEEEKKQKELNKACEADKPVAFPAASTKRASKGRGATPVSRGANTTSRPCPVSKKTATSTPTAKVTKPVAPSIARGQGTPGSLKRTVAVTSKPKAPVNIISSGKPAETQLSSAEKPPSTDVELVPVQAVASGSISLNRRSFVYRLGLARALSRSKETAEDATTLYREVINMAPEVPDAYIELADLISNTDPLAAVDVYCQYPQKPAEEQSFDDAFIPGEIIRLLMKCEKYDDPRLPTNMISYGKVMGIGCLEKYIGILDDKLKTNLLKTVYAGIHNKPVDDEDLQNFFRFKCWI